MPRAETKESGYRIPENKKKKNSLNQYINETELRSLIIRINNKTFNEHLSDYFATIDECIKKYRANKCKVSEQEILVTLRLIIKNNKYQLLALSDEDLKSIKSMIECDYNDSNTNIEDILCLLEPLNEEMQEKRQKLALQFKSDLPRINKYIRKHQKSKNQKFKRILREYITTIAERTVIDKISYERFGELVLLIIKNILKKPKFSGYTYRDEFYSDSTDKIFRYIKNFKHKMISKITNQPVNSFSYISQYVHNSIIFIINTMKQEAEQVQNYIVQYESNEADVKVSTYEVEQKDFTYNIDKAKPNELIKIIQNIICNNEGYDNYTFTYPSDYRISLDEYQVFHKFKSDVTSSISIIRNKDE